MADSQVFIKIVQNSEDILLASCPTEEISVCTLVDVYHRTASFQQKFFVILGNFRKYFTYKWYIIKKTY